MSERRGRAESMIVCRLMPEVLGHSDLRPDKVGTVTAR